MLDTKLIQVLRCFDAKETKKLYDFLDSPFFVKREKGVLLLRCLRNFFPTFEDKNLTKEFLYKTIFKDEVYNNLNFNRLLVYAMDIVEDFLRHYYLDITAAFTNKPLFDFYLKNQLNKHFESLHKSLEDIQEKSVIRNEEYLFEKWLLSAQNHLSESLHYVRENTNKLAMASEALDYFYIAKKLSYMCINLSNKNILNKEPYSFMEDELISALQNHVVKDKYPAILIFYHLYFLLKQEDEDIHFEKISELFATFKHILNPLEARHIYILLQNFCVRQMNKKSNIVYEKQLFNLYKEQLSYNLIYDINGNIDPSQFKNIIRLGLLLKEYEWAANFIEIYAEKISPDKRSDVENQAKAAYAFAIGQYQQTLKILQETEPIDIFFKIDAKRLLIRTYYELEEYELALSSLNTFRVFVHRDNLINENHKLTNRNFANLLTKLIQADKAAKVVKLLAEAKEMPSVADRKWLVEKIEMRVAEM